SPLLVASILEPWNELQRYRETDVNFADLTEDEVAQWMTIQAAHRARKLFADEDTTQLLTLHGKLVLLVKDQFAITIKKLSKRKLKRFSPPELSRSNYQTPRNVRFYRQLKNLGLPDVPRIVLGYQLLDLMTDIRIWIAYPRNLGK